MSKLAAVGLLALVLFRDDPSLMDMARRYMQIQIDTYDMKRTVCPSD